MNGLSVVLANKPGNPEEKNVGYTDYEEGIYVGYRCFQTKGASVSYPFGYGLSYTTFAYENAAVFRKGNTYTATVTVRNTGSVSGKEVVQLYVSAPAGKLDKPCIELKAFAKTGLLAPGETEVLRMQFTAEDLASFDEAASAFVMDKGVYEARFCQDAETALQSVSFTVPSDKIYPVSNVKISE
jgi:beta-glucosidase